LTIAADPRRAPRLAEKRYRLGAERGVCLYREFFFDAFSHCGDSGTYRTAKKITGIGFSPYLYHGLQYNFTDYFGVEGGIIVPAIFVMSIQWSFR
jgi:hypothetical protein